MNKEIEVGEYVRTNEGIIEKIKTIICNDYPIPALRGSIIIDDENSSILEYSKIVKHSKNIIDLIEVRRLCQWKRSKAYSNV